MSRDPWLCDFRLDLVLGLVYNLTLTLKKEAVIMSVQVNIYEAKTKFSKLVNQAIAGEEIIIAILFVISPFIVPVPMMLFSIFTGVLQAYIFTLLTCVYIGGAVKAHQQS